MVRWLKSLPEKVADSIVVPAVVAVLLLAATLFLGVLGDDVPVWSALIAALVLAGGAFALGRTGQGESEDLEDLATELQNQVDLHEYYADHLYEALETLQKVITESIPDVTFGDFVERGMLEPARAYLGETTAEEVRLSVLVPDDEGHAFLMQFSAGHSLEGARDFRLAIAGSFGGHAYSSGEIQWTGDVNADPRWSKHPKAREGREYVSLVSVPINVRDQVIGVMNVVSTDKDAFTGADRTYIELLASILSVAWSLVDEEDGPG